jgi:hypothetical protein
MHTMVLLDSCSVVTGRSLTTNVGEVLGSTGLGMGMGLGLLVRVRVGRRA